MEDRLYVPSPEPVSGAAGGQNVSNDIRSNENGNGGSNEPRGIPAGTPVPPPVWPKYTLLAFVAISLFLAFSISPEIGGIALCAYLPAVGIALIYQRRRTRREQMNLSTCCRMALLGLLGTVTYLTGGILGALYPYLAFLFMVYSLGILFLFNVNAGAIYGPNRWYWFGLGDWALSHGRAGNDAVSRNRTKLNATWMMIFFSVVPMLGCLASVANLAATKLMGVKLVGEHSGGGGGSLITIAHRLLDVLGAGEKQPDVGADVGGTFIMAFFSASVVEEGLKFVLVCHARALSNANKPWFLDQVLVYSLWAVLGFATSENLMYITSAGVDSWQSGLVTAAMRSVTAVPCHCFTALIIAVGVCQVYVVRQSRKRAAAILFAHYLLAVFLHGVYDWSLMMLSRPSIAGDEKSFKPEVAGVLLGLCGTVILCCNPISYCCAIRRTRKRIVIIQYEAPTVYRCSNCQLHMQVDYGMTQCVCPSCNFVLNVAPVSPIQVGIGHSVPGSDLDRPLSPISPLTSHHHSLQSDYAVDGSVGGGNGEAGTSLLSPTQPINYPPPLGTHSGPQTQDNQAPLLSLNN